MCSGSEDPRRIYVLLPVHNRREVTRRFIECLGRQEDADYHLVLLDDGSGDGTAAMVRETVPSVTVLRGDGTWWWAGALQKGHDWIRSQNIAGQALVCIANDDTVFEPGFLRSAVEVMAGNQKVLLLARCFDIGTGMIRDAGVHVDWTNLRVGQASAERPVNCLSTRGLFLSVDDFIGLGGFHPRLLPHYLSDYEFSLRAARAGFRLMTDPSVALSVDTTQTGYHRIDEKNFVRAIRKFFSRRSPHDPLAWTAFVLLACPLRWKLLNLGRVWLRAFRAVGGLAWASVTTGRWPREPGR
jgi:GT2 family glycosyltransferase